jgi:subtilisin
MIMANGIEETIANIGFAKVLVSLSSDASRTSAQALQRDMGNLFAQIDPGQERSLIAAAVGKKKGFATRKEGHIPSVRVFPHLGLALGQCTSSQLGALRSDTRVSKVELAPEFSLIRPVSSMPARAAVGQTWGIQRLRLPSAWAAGYRGKGVVVAHLDTGVDSSHPALRDSIHAFAEFDLTGEQVPNARPRDSATHGTHTAGTIAGRRTGRGEIGCAPECRLASALVIEGGDVIGRILGGLEWSIEQGSTVLSMSLGLRGFTPAFQTVINALRSNDVLPIIAVGNEGPNTSRSPGNYVNVLSVGAMNAQDFVSDFSGSQRFNRPDDPLVPDLVAPGEGVLSAMPGGHYAENRGTSMATPHIAGLAAVLRQAAPTANASAIEDAILASCRLPKGMLPDRGNRGVPDAVSALTHLEVQIDAVKPLRTRRASQRVSSRTTGNEKHSKLPKRKIVGKRQKPA